MDCKFCGATDVSANHVCKDKLAAMKYSCDSCGRISAEAGHLCAPVEIK